MFNTKKQYVRFNNDKKNNIFLEIYICLLTCYKSNLTYECSFTCSNINAFCINDVTFV